jgi:hypothetical protein
MSKALIGYTGFVGSNLHQQFTFNDLYNSKNIHEIVNKSYDEVYCAGVRAQKWLANAQPQEDLDLIKSLIENIKQAKIKRFVLISTIDVYPNPVEVDEDSQIDETKQSTYGRNRYYLEQWVMRYFEDYLIVRLPGLFGQNLKKNFIYDMINPIPRLLNKATMDKLLSKMTETQRGIILSAYPLVGSDFVCHQSDIRLVSEIFEQHQFSSLTFTDREDVFQYYDLSRLYDDLLVCKQKNIRIVNFACEPVLAAEVFKYVFNQKFDNSTERAKQFYDFHTKYAHHFGLNKHYIMDKQEVLSRIKQFVQESRS